MSDTAPRRLSRSTKIVAVLVFLIGWTALASGWTDKGCDYVPQSYTLVLVHGTPDANEGCVEDAYGTSYTDRYGS
jgi:hypothetical protein